MIDSEPAPKPRRRKLRGSSIGSARRSSHSTNATSAADAGDERRERDRVGPAALGALDDPEDERGERAGRDQCADRVEPRRRRATRVVGHDRQASRRGRAIASTTLSAEDRGPGEPLEQHAGREQAEDASAGGDAGPGADGLSALLGREDGGDDRQRDRHDERRTDAHQDPQPDQLRR